MIRTKAAALSAEESKWLFEKFKKVQECKKKEAKKKKGGGSGAKGRSVF